MIIHAIIEDTSIIKRRSFCKKEKYKILDEIKKRVMNGETKNKIIEDLSVSDRIVGKIFGELLGNRSEKSAKIVESCKVLLKEGKKKSEIIKMGYGSKLVQRAFCELYGMNSNGIQKEKTEEIRKLITEGVSVKVISTTLKCGAARVIREKRYMAGLGHKIKLNKRRFCGTSNGA